jgi:hypothetical protein
MSAGFAAGAHSHIGLHEASEEFGDDVAVQMLVVPLIAVREQAVVTRLGAVLPGEFSTTFVVPGVRSEVKYLKGGTRDDSQLIAVGGQATQHSRSSLSCLVEQKSRPCMVS